jgi:ATP-dependent RNA helicase DDX55/SPB4
MRAIVRADRALHDKAQRGFVSWVQAYRKHQAKSIFQLTDLDWKDLGNAWALLKMPKMPELKRWDGDRTLGLDLDFSSYEYKDKQRELQRRQSLSAAAKVEDKSANGAAEQHIEGGTLTNKPKRAWSQKLDEKEERERRREKRGKKREHEKWEAMTPAERQQKQELDTLIQTVKKQRTEEQDDVFEGFSD